MKKFRFLLTFVCLLLAMSFVFTACDLPNDGDGGDGGNTPPKSYTVTKEVWEQQLTIENHSNFSGSIEMDHQSTEGFTGREMTFEVEETKIHGAQMFTRTSTGGATVEESVDIWYDFSGATTILYQTGEEYIRKQEVSTTKEMMMQDISGTYFFFATALKDKFDSATYDETTHKYTVVLENFAPADSSFEPMDYTFKLEFVDNKLVRVDGESSHDEDGTPANYTWTFIVGGVNIVLPTYETTVTAEQWQTGVTMYWVNSFQANTEWTKLSQNQSEIIRAFGAAIATKYEQAVYDQANEWYTLQCDIQSIEIQGGSIALVDATYKLTFVNGKLINIRGSGTLVDGADEFDFEFKAIGYQRENA